MPTHFTTQKLPNEPIILSVMSEDYAISQNMSETDSVIVGLLDASPEKLFVISDISKVSFSFDDVIQGSSQGARGANPPWHHPKAWKTIFVTPSKMVRLAAAGLKTMAFGNLEVMVFDTLDEALAYCRAEIASANS